MDLGLRQLSQVLETADSKLRQGQSAGGKAWATGFDPLDSYLSGGVRSGELVLVGGPQGFGKTMWVLQALRNMVADGNVGVYFSYEHDEYTVLERLIALEAGLMYGPEAVGMRRIRAALEAVDGRGDLALEDRLADTTGGREALNRVQSYSPRMFFARSNGATSDLREIAERTQQIIDQTGELPVVVVDYLQKVPVPDGPDAEEERITLVAEGLKDLALRLQIPVIAIVAAEREGLVTGKRLRVNMLRGSSALAYEPDVILLMNDKYDVVARHHLVFDVGNAERFRSWAVMTIEKNRSGLDKIDLEFLKHFEQGRFDTKGQVVTEQLVDERVFVE
ncbi:MAG TPA: DnaB-like helicase C-terminal domain-containing protein [Nonomuraea sp.]|nr:DnaB-like helicase C-terminal domain-containing protein [Nonomuraea sp.]